MCVCVEGLMDGKLFAVKLQVTALHGTIMSGCFMSVFIVSPTFWWLVLPHVPWVKEGLHLRVKLRCLLAEHFLDIK